MISNTSSKSCCVCGKATTQVCSRCSAASIEIQVYSGECQKLVWYGHKHVCGSKPSEWSGIYRILGENVAMPREDIPQLARQFIVHRSFSHLVKADLVELNPFCVLAAAEHRLSMVNILLSIPARRRLHILTSLLFQAAHDNPSLPNNSSFFEYAFRQLVIEAGRGVPIQDFQPVADAFEGVKHLFYPLRHLFVSVNINLLTREFIDMRFKPNPL
ncbi:hypothetical protein JCM8547_008973 [Rhodosporidiobolus lusitaniae]